ncbi:MAG: Ig-like domain-containing protein, partial [Candidatus Zixiibacteriota bacterium]
MFRNSIDYLKSPGQVGKSLLGLSMILTALFGFGLLSMFGCSEGGGSSPNGPGGSTPKPLTVLSISPADGTVGISVNSPVVVTFSSPVDPATITGASFQVQGVSGTYSVNGAIVTFTPNSALAENTTYSVTLTTAIADMKGNKLEQNMAVSFATSARPQAGAGNDINVNRNEMVMLSATTNISNPVYKWRQLVGQPVGTLSGAAPGFVSPDTVTTLVFELIVSDGSSESRPDTVFVFVLENKNGSFWVHPSGDDNNPGIRNSPFATIQKAIGASAGVADVYVAAGTYVGAIKLVAGVSIYGGFNPGNWTRNIQSNQTTIDGSSYAVLGTEANDVTIDGLTIKSADGLYNGASSVAISLVRSQNVVITRNQIFAGKGAAGDDGVQPSRPGKANDGGNGTGAGGCIPANEGGFGGSGSGRAGGKGGSGGAAGGFDGSGGEGPCGNGGGGGFANTGGAGAHGCEGGAGLDADVPGPGFGSILMGDYANGNGYVGDQGFIGGGGGGG